MINLNIKDALYLAALASTEKDEYECRELAERASRFFKCCDDRFIDSYVWDAGSLMGLISVANEKEE